MEQIKTMEVIKNTNRNKINTPKVEELRLFIKEPKIIFCIEGVFKYEVSLSKQIFEFLLLNIEFLYNKKACGYACDNNQIVINGEMVLLFKTIKKYNILVRNYCYTKYINDTDYVINKAIRGIILFQYISNSEIKDRNEAISFYRKITESLSKFSLDTDDYNLISSVLVKKIEPFLQNYKNKLTSE